MSLVQLNTKYNTDCKKLLDYCNSLISSILSSRVSAIIKNTQINKIKNNFNAQLILLKNKRLHLHLHLLKLLLCLQIFLL